MSQLELPFLFYKESDICCLACANHIVGDNFCTIPDDDFCLFVPGRYITARGKFNHYYNYFVWRGEYETVKITI